ncbi:MAG: hypothetical protein AAFP19_02415 [Bacteroidota bacterium]
MKSLFLYSCFFLLLLNLGCQRQQPLASPTLQSQAKEVPASVDPLFQICEGDLKERLDKRLTNVRPGDSTRLKRQMVQIIDEELKAGSAAAQLECLMQQIPPLIKD